MTDLYGKQAVFEWELYKKHFCYLHEGNLPNALQKFE